VFDGQSFCYTGNFFSGTRAWCERETIARGGLCLPVVNDELRYLVIGSIARRTWAHSSFGTKIEKAVKIKRRQRQAVIEYHQEEKRGSSLAIVAEQHWQKALLQTPSK